MEGLHFRLPEEVGIESIPVLLQYRNIVYDQMFDTEHIELDFASVRWVDTMGLCFLSHWFEELELNGVNAQLSNMSMTIEGYLERMNLLRGYKNLIYEDRCSMRSRFDQARNLVEVSSVKNLADSDGVAYRMADTMISRIPAVSRDPDPEGMSVSPAEQAIASIGYIFSELLDNALTHGRRAGFRDSYPKVSVQFIRSRSKLTMSILDNGCGLLTSLRGHRELIDETDLGAIKLALKPRVSCNRNLTFKSDSVNQGVGLTVSTRLAVNSRGKFTVFSGNGYYNESGATQHIRENFMPSSWSGTGVYLEFDAAKLGALNPAGIMRSIPGYREVDQIQFG